MGVPLVLIMENSQGHQSGNFTPLLYFTPLFHKTAIQVFLFNPLPRSDPSQ